MHKEILRATDTDEDLKKYVNHVLIQIHQQWYEREELKNIRPTVDELKYWIDDGQL